MKKTTLSCLAILVASSSALAAQPSVISLDDTNPFDENAKASQMTEPKGLVSYSFHNNRNSVVEIEPDRQYLYEAQQTKMFGKVFTDASRVTNLQSEIKDRLSIYSEQKAKFTKRQLSNGHSSNEAAMQMFNKTTVQALSSVSIVLPEVESIKSYGSGTYIADKGWDTAISILKDSQLGNVIIERWNYKASNGGAILDSDAINISIMGNPGIFIVRDAGKKSESILSWVDPTTSFTIRADGDLSSDILRAKLIELADLVTIESSVGAY